ncbi:hypothetical protein BD410DRAFT_384416 [Rickenella mellea]|uniref:Uncharacterized protein n=1 Tax=Rickenella mellea TaxID=50990 RepID=A0A4Y7PYK9_9AGAM|nr:hypothetical protein BD410DRAFT_384416 [Rickenella mellea]
MDPTTPPTSPAPALPPLTPSTPTPAPHTLQSIGETSPNTLTSNSWIGGRVERGIVLCLITVVFIIMYRFILAAGHWEWLQFTPIIHILVAPVTLKRYPSAELFIKRIQYTELQQGSLLC